MNELEDRLRTALRSRAEEFTTSQDAWERTTARARRRLRLFTLGIPGRRGLARFTPLAAAAAVVAVAVTTAALASTGGWHDLVAHRQGSAITGGTPGPSVTPWPHRGQTLRQTCPATSAVISIATISMWVGRLQGHTGRWLCSEYASGGSAAPLFANSTGPAFAKIIDRTNDGTAVGIAATAVASVTAVLVNGQRLPGEAQVRAGFPYVVWRVKYPAATSAVIVFRDAAGHVVTRLNRPVAKPINPLAHPTPLTPADVGDCAAQGWNSQLVRVRQTVDGIETWTYIQFGKDALNGPSFCEHAGLLHLSTGFVSEFRAFPVLTPDRPVLSEVDLYNTSSISGFAAPWVTSVTAVTAGGKTYSGTFVNGRGFPYPVWLVSFPAKATATLLFRNAAGQVVATEHGTNGNWPTGP